MALTLTQELLALAQVKLDKAQRALEADPDNKWLEISVQFERDKVESIRRSLTREQENKL